MTQRASHDADTFHGRPARQLVKGRILRQLVHANLWRYPSRVSLQGKASSCIDDLVRGGTIR